MAPFLLVVAVGGSSGAHGYEALVSLSPSNDFILVRLSIVDAGVRGRGFSCSLEYFITVGPAVVDIACLYIGNTRITLQVAFVLPPIHATPYNY